MAVVCSQLLFSVFAPVLFCKLRLYGFTCVCVFCLRRQDQTGCLTVSYSCRVWFTLLPWHLAFGLLGLYACASVCECVSVLGGERVMVVRQLTSEAAKWRGGMYTDISQSREIVGQPAHLWLFSSEELGCVCVCFKFIASPSHLWLLRVNWLGSGLRRLVALMEVSFPQLLWSFSPQNDLLKTERQERINVGSRTNSLIVD